MYTNRWNCSELFVKEKQETLSLNYSYKKVTFKFHIRKNFLSLRTTQHETHCLKTRRPFTRGMKLLHIMII